MEFAAEQDSLPQLFHGDSFIARWPLQFMRWRETQIAQELCAIDPTGGRGDPARKRGFAGNP